MPANRHAKRKEAALARKPNSVNARGIARLDLGNGRSVGLKLTLAAMDEIETQFDIPSIADLEEKLQRPSAKSLAQLVAIMARASGEEISEDEIRTAPVELHALTNAVMAALGGGGEPDEKNVAAPSA